MVYTRRNQNATQGGSRYLDALVGRRAQLVSLLPSQQGKVSRIRARRGWIVIPFPKPARTGPGGSLGGNAGRSLGEGGVRGLLHNSQVRVRFVDERESGHETVGVLIASRSD
jgi:hypothetical protein